MNPRGTCAPIRFRVGRLQPGSATPPRLISRSLHQAPQCSRWTRESPSLPSTRAAHGGAPRPAGGAGSVPFTSQPLRAEEVAEARPALGRAYAGGHRDLVIEPRVIVWATGFGLDHSWIHAPVFDANGHLVHERGVTASPGLYFLGLPWQHTRGSALLGWVKDDAEYLARRISAMRPPQGPTRRSLTTRTTRRSRVGPSATS